MLGHQDGAGRAVVRRRRHRRHRRPREDLPRGRRRDAAGGDRRRDPPPDRARRAGSRSSATRSITASSATARAGPRASTSTSRRWPSSGSDEAAASRPAPHDPRPRGRFGLTGPASCLRFRVARIGLRDRPVTLKEERPSMRDHNKAFCRLVAETFDCPGPVYEFGSYQVEGQVDYADLRGALPGQDLRRLRHAARARGRSRRGRHARSACPTRRPGRSSASRRSSTSSRSAAPSTRSSASSSRAASSSSRRPSTSGSTAIPTTTGG